MTRLREIEFICDTNNIYILPGYDTEKYLSTVCIIFSSSKRITMAAQDRLCRTDAHEHIIKDLEGLQTHLSAVMELLTRWTLLTYWTSSLLVYPREQTG